MKKETKKPLELKKTSIIDLSQLTVFKGGQLVEKNDNDDNGGGGGTTGGGLTSHFIPL